MLYRVRRCSTRVLNARSKCSGLSVITSPPVSSASLLTPELRILKRPAMPVAALIKPLSIRCSVLLGISPQTTLPDSSTALCASSTEGPGHSRPVVTPVTTMITRRPSGFPARRM